MSDRPSTEIQPALTASEWEERAFSEGAEDEDGMYVDAQGDPSILSVTPVVREPDGGWRVGIGNTRQRVDIERRNGIAALALHEQPYGFTHEDVDDINDAAGMMLGDCGHNERRKSDDPPCRECRADAQRLRNIAARIAALLPPQP